MTKTSKETEDGWIKMDNQTFKDGKWAGGMECSGRLEREPSGGGGSESRSRPQPDQNKSPLIGDLALAVALEWPGLALALPRGDGSQKREPFPTGSSGGGMAERLCN